MDRYLRLIGGSLLAASTAAGGEFCGAEAANEILVDFQTRKAVVKALGARVATGDGLTVGFPKAGSGVAVSAPRGVWNLSQYVAVAVDVRNVGQAPVTLIGELNGRSWINSFLHVPGDEADTMVIHLLRKALEDRRKSQFIDMRGVPGGHLLHWDAFDPRAVKTLTLRDLDGVSVGQTVRIEAIRAVGRYGPLPPAKEKTFFPFVDRYGQFKHRDWPGKVNSDAGLK